MVGSLPACCARAGNDQQAAAPPSRVMLGFALISIVITLMAVVVRF